MAVRKDKTKGWIVDFWFHHVNGRRERIRQKAPRQTKRGAEEYERQLRQKLLCPTPNHQHKEVPTVAVFGQEFMDTYVQVHNKPSEIKSKGNIFRLYLNPQLGSTTLDLIGVREVDRLKGSLLKRGLSPKTINNALAVLGKLLRYAEEIGFIKQVPKIRPLNVPKPAFDFLSFNEADRLLDAAKKDDSEWLTLIYVALKTGLRWGELAELRWSDVDLVAGRLIVQRAFACGVVGTPKSGLSREVPLSPETVKVLKAHRHLRGDLVFSETDGSRHIYHRTSSALERICHRSGLREISWHVLRHTFASHLIMRGRSLKEVQELLGHSDYGMTLRYAHLAPSVKRDAVIELDKPTPQSAEVGHYLGTNAVQLG